MRIVGPRSGGFKPFKACVKSVLHCGFDDMPDVVLDIVPTMENITHDGKKFFRLKVTRQIKEDGSQWGVYLWEGWLNENMRRKGREDLVFDAPTTPTEKVSE